MKMDQMKDPRSTPSKPLPVVSAEPLEELWLVETAGHARRARLFRHPSGFEVRIDADGTVVETQVFEGREEADAFAEARRHRLNAGGMTDEIAPQ
jgi:hypothetical protein